VQTEKEIKCLHVDEAINELKKVI